MRAFKGLIAYFQESLWQFIIIVMLFFAAGCAVVTTEPAPKIALLAPFEGRYREVGYNALYAVRLALQDSNIRLSLLAVDDGGNVSSALDRVQALRRDDAVRGVLVLGYAATHADVLAALHPLSVIVVGHWDAQPAGDHVVMLANPALDAAINAPESISITDAARLDAPVTGGDVFALAQLVDLRPDLSDIVIVSSASLPDEAFRTRYINSDLFVPEAGLLATLTYDAAALLAQAIQSQTPVTAMQYDGLNGRIAFEAGYWIDAPINRFIYERGQLRPQP